MTPYTQPNLATTVRDALVALIKDLPNSFSKLTENQQAYYLDACNGLAADVAATACDIVAADGLSVLDVDVGRVTVGESNIEAKIMVRRDGAALQGLSRAAYRPAKLHFVDVGKHTADPTKILPEPDQRLMFTGEPQVVDELTPPVEAETKSGAEWGGDTVAETDTPAERPRRRSRRRACA